MKILGIETSCDETAVAIMDNGTLKKSLVSSQIEIHAKYGGVIPEIAARKHLEVIRKLFNQLLEETKIKVNEIDLIAVTQGPGLVGALLVGVSFAKGLSIALNKPIIPLNHVYAHVHGALLGLSADIVKSQVFPCFSLVVSGGHTNLFYMKDPVSFEHLVESSDDACGECFDKVAKLLGLAYPGGPIVEKLAKKGNRDRFSMPEILSDKKQLSFSYSGLKTHMYYLIQKFDQLSKNDISDLCASFQDAAFEQIIRKIKCVSELTKYDAKSILVAGGVAANQRFRQLLHNNFNLPIHFPELAYCSDNAAMVAAYAHQLYLNDKKRIDLENIQHDFEVYSRFH